MIGKQYKETGERVKELKANIDIAIGQRKHYKSAGKARSFNEQNGDNWLEIGKKIKLYLYFISYKK